MQYGPAALSTTELLSLFISTGHSGCSCLDISRQLLRKYGGLNAMGATHAGALAMEAGIGHAKAATLAAAFELGSRVAREQIQANPLDTPEVIYQHFAPQLQHLPQEQVLVVGLDTRLRHLCTSIVSIGTVNEASAHPREILRPVISRAAYAFILIHNHPSGDPSPSRADESVTRRINEAANLMQIQFLDHIIIGRQEAGRSPYYSFREAGMIS